MGIPCCRNRPPNQMPDWRVGCLAGGGRDALCARAVSGIHHSQPSPTHPTRARHASSCLGQIDGLKTTPHAQCVPPALSAINAGQRDSRASEECPRGPVGRLGPPLPSSLFKGTVMPISPPRARGIQRPPETVLVSLPLVDAPASSQPSHVSNLTASAPVRLPVPQDFSARICDTPAWSAPIP